MALGWLAGFSPELLLRSPGSGSCHGWSGAGKPLWEARDGIVQLRVFGRESFANPHGEKAAPVKVDGAGRPLRAASAGAAGPGRSERPQAAASPLEPPERGEEGAPPEPPQPTTSLRVPQRLPFL